MLNLRHPAHLTFYLLDNTGVKGNIDSYLFLRFKIIYGNGKKLDHSIIAKFHQILKIDYILDVVSD